MLPSRGRRRLFPKGRLGPQPDAWENREHQGRRHVRVADVRAGGPRGDRPPFALYYYSSPRSLTLSPGEDAIRRAIDRQEGKAGAGQEPLPPWLGESLALRVNGRGSDVLGRSAKREIVEELQVRSRGDLTILDEWRRHFPGRDPVAVHEAAWGTALVDPGGGRYTRNPRWETMGVLRLRPPGRARTSNEANDPASRFRAAGHGLRFEGGGLRARTEIRLRPRP
ncbi:MAG TPA: hypothetical protein VGH33_17365 [Isosphaeraceae bacterium]